MEKKTITITAPAGLINAVSMILVPVSIQQFAAERLYITTLRTTIEVCLS
jgi:hypothetical protein